MHYLGFLCLRLLHGMCLFHSFSGHRSALKFFSTLEIVHPCLLVSPVVAEHRLDANRIDACFLMSDRLLL